MLKFVVVASIWRHYDTKLGLRNKNKYNMFRGSKSESCITLSDCLLNIGSSFWMIVISCFNLDHNLITLFSREANYKNAKSSQRRHKLGLTCRNTRFSYLYGRCFCAVARVPPSLDPLEVYGIAVRDFVCFIYYFMDSLVFRLSADELPVFWFVFTVCAYVLQQTDSC